MKAHWKLIVLYCIVAMQSIVLKAGPTQREDSLDSVVDFRIPTQAISDPIDHHANQMEMEGARRTLLSFPLHDIDEEEDVEGVKDGLEPTADEFQEDGDSLNEYIPTSTSSKRRMIPAPSDDPPSDDTISELSDETVEIPTHRDIQDPILSATSNAVDYQQETKPHQGTAAIHERPTLRTLTRQPTIIDARRLDQSEEGRKKQELRNRRKVAAYQPRPDHETLGLQLDFKQGAIDALLGFAADFFFLGEGRWDDIFQMTLPKSFTDIGIHFNLGHLDITETIRELERPNVYKIDLKKDGFHVHVGGAKVEASMTLGHRWRKESERFFLESEGTVQSNVDFRTIFMPIIAEMDPEELRDKKKGNSRLTSHTSHAHLQRLAKDRISREASKVSLLSTEEEETGSTTSTSPTTTSAPVQLQLVPLQPNFLFENGLLWKIKRQDFLPRIVNKLLNGRLKQMLANVLQDLIVDEIQKHLPEIIGDFVHTMVRSLFDSLEGLLQGAPDNLVEKTTNVLKLENPSVKISDGLFSIATGMHIDFGKQDVSLDQDEIRQWFYKRPPLHWNHGHKRDKPVQLLQDSPSGPCKESKYARMAWWKRVWRPWTWFRRYPIVCQDEQERKEESTIKWELSLMPKTLGVSKEARRVMDCVNRYCAWFFKWQSSKLPTTVAPSSEEQVDKRREKLRSYELDWDTLEDVPDVDVALNMDDAALASNDGTKMSHKEKLRSHELNWDDHFVDDDGGVDGGDDADHASRGHNGVDDERYVFKRSLPSHPHPPTHPPQTQKQAQRQRLRSQASECQFVDALFQADFAKLDLEGVVIRYDDDANKDTGDSR